MKRSSGIVPTYVGALAMAVLVAGPGHLPAAGQQPFPASSPAEQGVDGEVLAQLDSLIQGFVTAGEIVGAEFLVVRNRRTVHHRGFGWRDEEDQVPMEPGTIFNLRSMAKPLVGSLAQRLEERGLVDFEAPASRYLDSFSEGPAAEIRVGQLLSHRSGLPDGNPTGRPADYPTLKSVADYWGHYGPTAFEPGEGFLYSDPGADVVAVILREVSGRTLPELAQEEVFGPLGMTDAQAYVTPATSTDPRFASDYRWDAGEARWLRYWKPGDGALAPFPIGSGTTWYATAKDYACLLAAWIDGGVPEATCTGGERWLETSTTERALTPQSPMPYPSRLPGVSVQYGQMWIVYLDGSGERVAFGHSGSDGTYAYAWPESDLMVFYMTQSRGNRTRLLLEPLFGELVAEMGEDGR